MEKDPALPRPDHPLLGHLPHPDVLRNPDRRIFLAGEKQVKLISCFLMFLLSTGFEVVTLARVAYCSTSRPVKKINELN